MEEEITKAKFKELYFKYGNSTNGWTTDYWNQNFEKEQGGRYYFTKPASPSANRMFIVSEKQKHRMIFLTEEGEESFFNFPD